MNKKEFPSLFFHTEKNKYLKKMIDYFKQMTTYEKLIHNTFYTNAKDNEKLKLNFEYLDKNINFLKKEIKKVKTDFDLKNEKDKENFTVKNLILTLKSELKYWELCKQELTHQMQEKERKDLQNE